MLGKLIKNEFRNTFSFMFIISIGIIAMHLIFKLIGIVEDSPNIAPMLLNVLKFLDGVYVFSMIAINGIIFTYFLIRFHQKIYLEQGYLIHTLPVKKSAITIAMLISSITWTVVIAVLSVGRFALTIISNDSYVRIIKTIYRMISRGDITTSNIVIFIIMCALSLIHAYMLGFLCISIGHNYKSHPIVGAIIAYWIISVILTTLSILITSIIGKLGFFRTQFFISAVDSLDKSIDFMFGLTSVITLIITVIYFAINNRIMSRNLNLS